MFTTSYGPALTAAPVPLHIPRDPCRAAAFAVQADRSADLAMAEGRIEQAERLAHAALEARCRAGAGRHPR